MSDLLLPAVLDDLARAGKAGMPLAADPEFQKGLQLCREWGFRLQIEGERVRLPFNLDQLIPFWIQKETPAIAWEALNIRGFLRLPSTNSAALSWAMQGAPAGSLVLAEEQSAGRGRKNRTWFSQPGAGVCCSLILRPKQVQKYWPLLTLAASVALVDALKELMEQGVISAHLDIDIKWPNDVLLSGRKCAGILLETLMHNAECPCAVVGFGINVRQANVPPSLAGEAVSLDEMAAAQLPRRQILVGFLRHFQKAYVLFEAGKRRELLEKWKAYSSMWDGVRVWIGEDENRREAITCGLTEIGALRVRRADGSQETVLADSVRIAGQAPRNNAH